MKRQNARSVIHFVVKAFGQGYIFTGHIPGYQAKPKAQITWEISDHIAYGIQLFEMVKSAVRKVERIRVVAEVQLNAAGIVTLQTIGCQRKVAKKQEEGPDF